MTLKWVNSRANRFHRYKLFTLHNRIYKPWLSIPCHWDNRAITSLYLCIVAKRFWGSTSYWCIESKNEGFCIRSLFYLDSRCRSGQARIFRDEDPHVGDIFTFSLYHKHLCSIFCSTYTDKIHIAYDLILDFCVIEMFMSKCECIFESTLTDIFRRWSIVSFEDTVWLVPWEWG